MDEKLTCELIAVLKEALSGNRTHLSDLTKAITALHLDFKEYENICKSTDLTALDIKTEVVKIGQRIDGIDKWQKVRMPIIIGTITLVLYSIGFFFMLDKVSGMIISKHPAPVVQTIK